MTRSRADYFLRVSLLALLLGLPACSRGPEVRYGYTFGQSEGFVIWITQQIKNEIQPDSFTRLIMRGRLNLRVRAVAPDGTTSLEFWLENMSGQLQNNTRQEELLAIQRLNGFVLQMQLGPRGEVLSIQTPTPPEPEASSLVQNFRQTLRELWPSLPSRLSHGTSWSRTLKSEEDAPPMGFISQTTQSSYEVREPQKVGQRQALELDTHYRLTLKVHKKPATNVNTPVFDMQATGDGAGSLYIDPKDGRLIAAVYETTLNFSGDGAPELLRAQLRQEVRSRVELRPIESSSTPLTSGGATK